MLLRRQFASTDIDIGKNTVTQQLLQTLHQRRKTLRETQNPNSPAEMQRDTTVVPFVLAEKEEISHAGVKKEVAISILHVP